MTRPLRLAMIGCGLISHAHARAAAKLADRVQFVAAVNPTLERAVEWGKTYGVAACFDTVAAMLSAVEIDAVVIAAPPMEHFTIINTCLDAGTGAILCEKPLATSANDAIQLWDHAQKCSTKLVPGFMYRHHPAIKALHVRLPKIGAIDTIFASFNMLAPYNTHVKDGSWRRNAERGGGVPHDFLCYPVDAALGLAGSSPQSVTATGSRCPLTGTINRLTGMIAFDNGVSAIVSSSRKSAFAQHIEVNGSTGQLAIERAFSNPSDAHIIFSQSSSFLDFEQQTQSFDAEPNDGRLMDLAVFTHQMSAFADIVAGADYDCATMAQSVVNAIVIGAMIDSFVGGIAVPISLDASLMTAAFPAAAGKTWP